MDRPPRQLAAGVLHVIRAAHAASLAQQRWIRAENDYWTRVYWLRETTRAYLGF